MDNDGRNGNIVDLSPQKKEAMDKIRVLEEEVPDTEGATDTAKAAIKTSLEEEKTAEATINDLQNERDEAVQGADHLQKQCAAAKKEQGANMSKVQETNDELNHQMRIITAWSPPQKARNK